MLISRMMQGCSAIRRRPEIPYNFVEFMGSAALANVTTNNLDAKAAYSSYYYYEAFDNNLTTGYEWAWSSAANIMTSSIDTTPVWLDIAFFKPTVMGAFKFYPRVNGYPSRFAIYGSNTGAFKSADRTLVLESGTLSYASHPGWTAWFENTGTKIRYKFFRIYFLDSYTYFPTLTGINGITEVGFKIDDTSYNATTFKWERNITSRTVTASVGTGNNAFANNATAWKIDATTFIPDCWLQLQLPASRSFAGWRINDYQSTSYGKGVPGNYSLYGSNTGAFSGEQTTIFNNAVFDATGMLPFPTATVFQRSPWQCPTSPAGPFTYYRWVFHTWNYLGTTTPDNPGIAMIWVALSA